MFITLCGKIPAYWTGKLRDMTKLVILFLFVLNIMLNLAVNRI